jgi:ribosomal protein S25
VENLGCDMLSINETVQRSKVEGIPITQTALRQWVKNGDIHAVYAGRKALLYWPAVVKFLCGEGGV